MESLTGYRSNISTRNISYSRRELGKSGFTRASKPVGGSEEKMGYSYRKKKIQDPYAQQRKFRDISRGISRSKYRTGFRQQ